MIHYTESPFKQEWLHWHQVKADAEARLEIMVHQLAANPALADPVTDVTKLEKVGFDADCRNVEGHEEIETTFP